MNKIKVGCCGFPINIKEYFKKFKTAEIQKTFYKPIKIETAKKWREIAGNEFEFTLKAWQLITHECTSPTYRKAGIKVENDRKYGNFSNTKEVFEAWDKTYNIAKALNASFILFQCPKSFEPKKENIDNIYSFFSSIERDIRFAFEPRGKEWSGKIKKICDELKLVHCVDPFISKPKTKEIFYYRLHGIGGYKYRYSIDELRKLKEFCIGRTYCFFNNVYMYDNSLEFLKLIGEK
ncbi:MAG: DUF72 domain-containing protein [Candidatus Thermoplasmatota archaeon]